MRISDWSSDVCSSDLRMMARADDSLPRRQQATIRQLAREIDETLAGFLRGQGTVCLSLAVFYAIGLTLAGLEFVLVVGLIAGFLSFFPYPGSLVGLVLSAGLAPPQFHRWNPVAHLP